MRLFRCCFTILLALLTVALPSQDHSLHLSDKKLRVADFPYYITQVTDAREQTYCLGFTLRGLNNHRATVFSKDSLTTELAGLFARSFGGDTTGRRPLVVRVNRIFLYETKIEVERAFLEISLSFLTPTGPGTYLELATIGATTERVAVNAMRQQDENLVAGVRECLEAFRDRERRGILHTRPVNAAALQQPLDWRTFAGMQAERPLPGVYRTFSDFLENTPDDQVAFTLERQPANRKSPEYYTPIWGRGYHPDDQIWGLSDGQYAYALVDGVFYRLDRTTEGCFLTIPGPPSAEAIMNGVLLGSLIGGAAGGALGGAIANKAGPPTRFQIEPLTSSLAPAELPNARRVEARVVFFCSEYSATPITVRLDGQEICTLEKGTFHRLKLPPPRRELAITLEAKGKSYQTTVSPAMFNTQLCLLRMVRGEPRLDLPDGELRQKMLGQVAKGEVEERCKQ